jgi:hypothetical protein
VLLKAIRDAFAAVNIVSPIELDGVNPNDIIAAMRAHLNSPRAAGADMVPATEALVKRIIRRCQPTDTQQGEHLAFSFDLTLYHVQVPAPQLQSPLHRDKPPLRCLKQTSERH